MVFFPFLLVMACNPTRSEAGCGSRHTSKLFHALSLRIFRSRVSVSVFSHIAHLFKSAKMCNYGD